jgi:uncharacterized protein (DUF433 family)/DNA-binding transcriptional MerR regulator
VSGETIGQWARRGYIQSSWSVDIPRVYSFQDVAEAIVVHELLERGVKHRDIRKTIANLRSNYGDWPLTAAPLATSEIHRGRSGGGKEIVALITTEGARDIGHASGDQLWLPDLWDLRAIAGLLRRGGWAVISHPEIEHVEVDPDRLSGRPTIRDRRIPAEKVALLAETRDGRIALRADYRLTARQIDDAVRWYQAVSEYEAAA